MEPWHYIVLLGLVLVVYAAIVPNRKRSGNHPNVMAEIEQTMKQFSDELEEENRQLLGLVSDMKKEHDLHTAKLQGRIEALERQNREVGEQLRLLQAERARPEPEAAAAETLLRVAAPSDAATAESSAAGDPSADTKQQPNEPMKIRERYADVFHLYDKGESTEYIAKKLEMNKGEVMLIIQLAKQEEQARA